MIALLSLQFGKLPYFALSEQLQREYCSKYELPYELVRGEFYAKYCKDRNLIWGKVLAVREFLELHSEVEGVLYLDADAVPSDTAPAPEELVSALPIERSLLLSEDDTPGLANTGAWFIRNNETAKALLTYWWEHPGDYLTQWPVDEGAFNQTVRPVFQEHIELFSRSQMDWVRGHIRHFMAGTVQRKLRLLQNEAARRTR